MVSNKLKKPIKKSLAIIIAFLIIMGSTPPGALSKLRINISKFNPFSGLVFAVGGESAGSNATWNIDDNGILTLSGTGNVTNIGWDSVRSDITCVVIETGITSVPDNAFSDCVNLETVSFASTLSEIGAYAFAGCSVLKNVNIPGSVTGIGSYAFAGSGLVNVTISDGVASIGDYCFQGCISMTRIVIPDSVTHIGTNAFDDCGDSVIYCGNGSYAYKYCSENNLLCVRDIDSSHTYRDTDFVHFGAPLHYDEMFANSLNDVAVYNNLQNGTITINKVSKEADCPTQSSYMLEITNTGSAYPGFGGFRQRFVSSSGGEVYYHVFIAKIPVGYKVNAANNSLGYQPEKKFLTSQEGTGDWELYIYRTRFGIPLSNATSKDAGYVYLTGDASVPSTENPLKWYVGYTNVFSYEHKSYLSDAMFASGTGNASYYNNNHNNSDNVTVSRVTASSDCPSTSGYMLQVQTSSGTSKPGLGGFCQRVTPEAGKTYYHRILAKIPKGYRLEYKTNYITACFNWITSNEGTGDWQTYCYRIEVDKNPTQLGTFGFLALYPDGMESESVADTYTSTTTTTWYVGYSDIVGGYEFSEYLKSSDLILTQIGSLNGHTYCRYDYDLKWQFSKALCEKLGGHLATVLTAAEESTISSLCSGSSYVGYWLGATDITTEGVWKWITGETWSYTAWGASQPDNSTSVNAGGENYLEYYVSTSAWNDISNTSGSRGFICEFEPNYVPVKSVVYNNHLYSLYNESLNWVDAESVCVNAGGHLASISSAEEQSAINDLINGQLKGLYWIGAHFINDNWSWSSNESFSYSNWGPGEPSDVGEDGGSEDYAHIYSRAYNTKVLGNWNNTYNNGSASGYYHINNCGFICEIDLNQFIASEGSFFRNNYYEIYPQFTFWTEAESFAESRGGHLVTIADEDENSIAAQLSETVNSTGCWYGGSDFGNEGVWSWVDKTPFNYTDWQSGEPNNSNLIEHFNHYYTREGGGWNDARNNYTNMCFIVEYESAVGSSDGVDWSYDGNALTLSGSGDLSHIDQIINTSWFEHIRDIQFDGEFDVVITPFKNTEWYSELNSGPVEVDGILLDYKGDMPEETELSIDNVVLVAPNALSNQPNLKSISFDYTLEQVSALAFENCSNLISVTLSDNVRFIEDNAFNGCSNLTITGYYNPYVENYADIHGLTYAPFTITLTLNPTQGHTDITTLSVVAKKALGNIQIPDAECTGCMFNGWHIDEECLIPVNAESVFNEDATIYASWIEAYSIVIKSEPDTLQYVVGDYIDTTGMVLTARFPNGETIDYNSGFTCTPERFTRQGKYRVKVSFKDNIAYFYVTVKEPADVTMSVATLPDKMNYETGDDFDPTGLTLLVDYGNGITKTVKKGFTADYDFSTAGTKCVTISYIAGDTVLSTEINVEVTEADYVVYSDEIVCSGDTFDIPVKIKGNRGLMEISLNLTYDSDLIRPVSMAVNNSLDGIISNSMGEEDGAFTVYWSGNEAYFGNGTLFTVTFESLVSRKSVTEIGITYNSAETCDEDWMDISLVCMPVNVSIVVPEAPLFFSDSIDTYAGDTVDIPVYVSNSLNLTQAAISLSYNKDVFSLESVNSPNGTVSVINGNNLQVSWNGSAADEGVLFTVRLSVDNLAVGKYNFSITCSDAVFEDTGTVKCRDFSVNVQNQNAAKVYFESGYLVPGEDNDVYVMIDTNPGVMGFSLNINYDPDVFTFKTVAKCELTRSGSFDYTVNDGVIKLVWNCTDDITSNGALFKLKFSAAEGSYTSSDLLLSYSLDDTFDSDWNAVVFDCKDSKLLRAYTATFYLDGVAVDSQNYTIETDKLDEPVIPSKPNCFARWQCYNLKNGGDIEIHDIYESAKITAPVQKTLHIGETYKIITSGNFDATRYEWRSDNTSVATVDNHGMVTAVGSGTAIISVRRYGEDSFGNEVSAKANTTVKVTKEKEKYDSVGDWIKASIERFFDEILYDILESLKRSGFIIFHKSN